MIFPFAEAGSVTVVVTKAPDVDPVHALLPPIGLLPNQSDVAG